MKLITCQLISLWSQLASPLLSLCAYFGPIRSCRYSMFCGRINRSWASNCKRGVWMLCFAYMYKVWHTPITSQDAQIFEWCHKSVRKADVLNWKWHFGADLTIYQMLYFCKLLLRIFSIVIMLCPWTHFGWNIYTQCDLAGKRNYMFYTLRYSFNVADPSNLKFHQEILKELFLLYLQNCEFSPNGVNLAT